MQKYEFKDMMKCVPYDYMLKYEFYDISIYVFL